jgi:FkbM family methyltransferase
LQNKPVEVTVGIIGRARNHISKRLNFLRRTREGAALRDALGPRAMGVIYDTEFGPMACAVGDRVIARTLGAKGVWDKKAVQHLCSLVDKNSTVLVIGAHIGTLLIPLSRHSKDVVAYEANANTFALLNLNLRMNRADNVVTYNLAAGDAHRWVQFLQNWVNTGGSKISPKTASYAFTYDGPSTVDVEMVSLDEHLGGQTFDLIILDIEGAEVLALRGMQGILSRAKHLHMEYLPHLLDGVTGTTDEQLLDTLRPHFSSVRIQGTGETFGGKDFLSVLQRLRATGGDDLTFSRLVN